MKNRYPLFFLALIVLSVVGITVVYNRSITATSPRLPKPPSYPFAEAEKMAYEKLPLWLESIQNTNSCVDFGFKNCEETQHATLGTPYIIYSFNIQDMTKRLSMQGNIRDQLDGGVDIVFPVLFDGEARSVILVAYKNDTWAVGSYGGFQPTRIVGLQQRLQAQGIQERVDVVGFSDAVFGLLDYKRQTILIPLEDRKNIFPELDWSGNHMYQLAEIVPLVHVQAQKMMSEYERNIRESEERNRNRTPFVRQPTRVVEPAPTYIPPRVYPAPDIPTPVGATSLPASTAVPIQAPDSVYPAP